MKHPRMVEGGVEKYSKRLCESMEESARVVVKRTLFSSRLTMSIVTAINIVRSWADAELGYTCTGG